MSCKWVEAAVWKGDETLWNIGAGTMLWNCIGMALCDLISVYSCHKHTDIKNLEPHVHTTKALKVSNLMNKFRKWSHQDSRIQILIVCQKIMSSINYYILDWKTKLACYSLFSRPSPKFHLNRYLSLVAIWEVGYWNSPRT